MPRAYLVSECRDKKADPIGGQPTYLLVAPVDWNHEFEYWFVDENYACLDDEGHRYALRWDSKTGMSAEMIEESKELKARFYAWLDIWIDSLPQRLKTTLNIADTRRDGAYLSKLLDQPDMLRSLT